jgi:hypothetical protein
VFWHASPLYVGFRLGACLVLLALLAPWPRWPLLGRAVAPLAQRSLTAYVVHLVLLYGSPWSAGLTRSLRLLALADVWWPSALVLGASWLACGLGAVLRALRGLPKTPMKPGSRRGEAVFRG